MNIKNFITEAINILKEAFPTSTLKYEYQGISDTHLLEITPTEIFNSDEFMDVDIKLIDQFYALNLDTDFSIISDCGLTKLDKSRVVYSPKPVTDYLWSTIVIQEEMVTSKCEPNSIIEPVPSLSGSISVWNSSINDQMSNLFGTSEVLSSSSGIENDKTPKKVGHYRFAMAA
jgi:hypothetical protein